MVERDSFAPVHPRRVAADLNFRAIFSDGWADVLKSAFQSLPGYSPFSQRPGKPVRG